MKEKRDWLAQMGPATDPEPRARIRSKRDALDRVLAHLARITTTNPLE